MSVFNMNKEFSTFVRSHNLVNRIYDMAIYYKIIKTTDEEKIIKKFFHKKLKNLDYVETLAKYFEDEIQKSKNNIELQYNLKELVYDLNYLKQYLS